MGESRVELKKCPGCKEKSLYYNSRYQFWECLNPNHKGNKIYSPSEVSKPSVDTKERPNKPQYKPITQQTNIVISTPLWLVNLLESKRFWAVLLLIAAGLWSLFGIMYPFYRSRMNIIER